MSICLKTQWDNCLSSVFNVCSEAWRRPNDDGWWPSGGGGEELTKFLGVIKVKFVFVKNIFYRNTCNCNYKVKKW